MSSWCLQAKHAVLSMGLVLSLAHVQGAPRLCPEYITKLRSLEHSLQCTRKFCSDRFAEENLALPRQPRDLNSFRTRARDPTKTTRIKVGVRAPSLEVRYPGAAHVDTELGSQPFPLHLLGLAHSDGQTKVIFVRSLHRSAGSARKEIQEKPRRETMS